MTPAPVADPLTIHASNGMGGMPLSAAAFHDALRSRRSIRRFRADAVAPATLERLFASVAAAPSAHNRQPWRFVVIEKAEAKAGLARAMGARLAADRRRDGDNEETIARDVARSFARITSAPVVTVVCMTLEHADSYRDTARSDAEFLMSVQGTAMAAQNLMLAAHAEGLASCWMCAPLFCPDVVRNALGIPEHWQPQGLIVLGIAAEGGRDRPRRPIGDFVMRPGDCVHLPGVMKPDDAITVVALAGGVGGAKLADGLARILGARLTVVVNTGDDFEHLGLHISPDLDTVMYTLAGIANPETGWGIAGESWSFMDQVARLGGPTWFRLGDRDLATHALRTTRLRAGETLTRVMAELAGALGVVPALLPMCDESVRTMLTTPEGELEFQHYFVRLACKVAVTAISYRGATAARMNPALASVNPDAIIICPSNPFLSVDPILAVPGMREWMKARRVPIIAISPIVGGAAIKGPAAKIMAELGQPATAAAVARHYAGLIDGLVIDETDAGLKAAIEALGIAALVAPSVMRNAADRVALARACLAFAREIADNRRS